jgi:hypothetical protein
MKNTNAPGLYPSILVHHSNYAQLAIGGAMINHVHEDEGMAECYEAKPLSGGWHTRFDGGNGNRVSDMPCHIVSMYVEGLINISGCEGAYDSETVIEPWCFAVVVFRSKEQKDYMSKVTKPAEEQYVYLFSGFSFGDNVRHDGVYDLKEAFETARNRGSDHEATLKLRYEDKEWDSHRSWRIIRKKHVPGRIRQILHRTVDQVESTVDNDFGQGKKFFQLPQKKK